MRADDRAVKRMLINTVGNAHEVHAGRRARDGGGARRMARWCWKRSTTARAFPKEERASLGKPTSAAQAARARKARGLGLSLVRALAGLHGGALSFHDAPGGGALVRMTLPVLAAISGCVRNARAAAMSPTST